MRLARIHAPGEVRIDTVDDPQPGPRDAVVAVHACGLCGSDISFVRAGGLAGPGPEPLALGHEFSGVVTGVGAEVRDFAVGDRVVVHPGDDEVGRIGGGGPNGALADACLVTEADRFLYPVPDDVDLTMAALTEPVGVGMRAAQRLDLGPGDSAVVVGCGPVGLAAIATLCDSGVDSVIGIDPGQRRRELAVELGAAAAYDPHEESLWRRIAEHHGRLDGAFRGCVGTSGFVEASGQIDMLRTVVQRARPLARISVVAVYVQDVELSLLSIMMKELDLRGSMEYPDRFTESLELLQRRDLRPMITDLVSLEEAAVALADPERLRAGGKMLALVADLDRAEQRTSG